MNLCGWFDVFTRRVGRSRGGRRCQKRREPEGSAVMDRGSGDTWSSDARSVYLCRCWMTRRAWAVARRSAPRKEAKEEQLVQQSVVVASSGARTTNGAGFSKTRREVVSLGAYGVWVCLRPPQRWYCFPLRFLLRVVPRLRVLRRRRRRLVLLLLRPLTWCVQVCCVPPPPPTRPSPPWRPTVRGSV